jgi:integrase
MTRRDRGTGSVYLPKGSSVYWCQYYMSGRRVRESTKETDKRKATIYLNKRLQECAVGIRNVDADKVTVDTLMDTKLTAEKNNGSKSLEDMEADWRLHLKPFFGNMKGSRVTTALLNKYIEHRKATEIVKFYKLKTGEIRRRNAGRFPANATINRELSLLRAAMYMGYEATPPTVQRVPHFPMLEERNVRKGFLTDEQYSRLCDECAKVGLWLRVLLELGATLGWRRNELLRLRVNQVDLSAKSIRLNPGETKNDEGREVSMTSTLHPLLTACIEGKKPDDFVITRPQGSQVRYFRATWNKVTTAAGVPGLLFHDLRRTAARALRRAGVAEGVIMKIGGWKTRNVFERYAIVSQSDIRDAMAKLEQQQSEISQRIAKEDPESDAVDDNQAVN